MAKYSDIKGFTVQTLASDPAASKFVGGAWSSASSMNNARLDMGSSQAAPQSSGILAGGSPTPGYDKSEAWNGSSWSEVAELNQPRGESPGGAGIYTSAIVFGGFTTTNVANSESWNGSAWTATPALNSGRRALSGGFGTANTAAIAVGGYASSTVRNNVESWDGSSWTEVNEMNTGRNSGASVGTTTAGILYGGSAASGVFNNVETYDGTSFTETTEINTARDGLAGAGTQTSALASGGYATDRVAITEHWDGSSWTELADLSLARDCNNNGFGTADAALVGGGSSAAAPSGTAVTELFDAPVIFSKQVEGQLYFNSTTNTFKETLKDFVAGTWSSANGLNNGRTGVSGARNTPGHGTGLAMAGFTTPPLTARGYTEEYDGTSWSEETDTNQSRGQTSGTGTSSTAGLLYGGETYPSPANVTSTETWNGSSWTEVNELNVAGRGMGNCGTTIAALAIAGTPEGTGAGDRGAKTEVWDGTSWTESGDIPSVPSGLSYNCAFGTTTAATTTGGGPGPAGYKRKAWSWTGSSWTETTENNSDKTGGMAFGSNADSGYAMVSSTTEFWNGTAWAESADQSTGKTEGGSGGVSDSGLAFGGNNANTTTTEEFDVSLGNKTITSS